MAQATQLGKSPKSLDSVQYSGESRVSELHTHLQLLAQTGVDRSWVRMVYFLAAL